MHTKIPYQRTNGQRKERPASAHAAPMKPGIPNSASLSMLSGAGQPSGMPIDELGRRMAARLPTVRARPQAQIPQAENEADRLSSAVNAGTPESVKAVMGQRMGADFSGVRFHTGAAAAAKADAMGARAYTSGADVYFGTGGFDAAAAAHELVHTAQQGMVDSGVATMSTPVGGVQMVPGRGARAKQWIKEHAEKAKEKTWDKTGGRLIRKHHDAMAELHEAMQAGGDWSKLSAEEQASWKKRNYLAYKRYTHSDGAKRDTARRVIDRSREMSQAKDFLDTNAADLGKHSSMLTTEPAASTPPATTTAAPAAAPPADKLVIGHKKADAVSYGNPNFSLGDAAETGVTVADDVGKTSLDLSQSAAETAEAAQSGSSAIGAAGGALGILTGVAGAVSAAGDIREAAEHKHKMGVVDSGVDLAGKVSQMGSGAAAIAKAALTAGSGAAEAAGDAVAGFDVVGGAANVYLGGRDIYKGAGKIDAMNAFQDKYYYGQKRENLKDDNLLFHDMATQAKLEGSRQIAGGVGKAFTGGADALAGALELGGVTAGAGLGVKAASAAAKVGFGIADSRMHHHIKKGVVEQTTGITDDQIRKFQKDNNIKSFSRAKQALMKAMGYGSGQREEVFADQTAKRGKILADKANDTAADNHDLARELAEGMGTRKDSGGKFEGGKLAKAMGLRRSRGEIAGRKNRIKYMLSRRPASSTPPPPTP